MFTGIIESLGKVVSYVLMRVALRWQRVMWAIASRWQVCV